MLFAGMASAWPQDHPDIREEVVQITPEQHIKIYAPVTITEPPLPAGLYIHCGGWYAGAVEFEDGLCRDIVRRSKIVLFSPHYRLAPEHPFPAGLEDVCRAYEWMHDNASRYGADPHLMALMGGSAGANLALCLGVKYATDLDLRPAAVLAGAGGGCDPEAMPAHYKQRLTPEKYADVPMFSQDDMKVARGELSTPDQGSLSDLAKSMA